MPVSSPAQVQHPLESVLHALDFADLLEAGETLASVQTLTVSPSGLTAGSPALVGTQVQVLLAGGTTGVTYLIQAVVLTSVGDVRVGQGHLLVTSTLPGA